MYFELKFSTENYNASADDEPTCRYALQQCIELCLKINQQNELFISPSPVSKLTNKPQNNLSGHFQLTLNG